MAHYKITPFYPIHCITGVVADAATGKPLRLNTNTHQYEFAYSNHSTVNKKTRIPIFAASISFDQQKLMYSVLRADRVTKRGLRFDPAPVFSAMISKEGIRETGTQSLRYWLKDGIIAEGLLTTEEQLSANVICNSMFHWPASALLPLASSDSPFEM